MQPIRHPVDADEDGLTMPLPEAKGAHDAPPGSTKWSARRWYVIYGMTGAVALGFEQVFFRLIDGVMRSNTYTFGHVLALFLALLAVGTAIGSAVVTRVRDHRRWFLWMQFGVGASALASLTFFVRIMPRLLPTEFESWFTSGGMTYGINLVPGDDRLLYGLLIPVLLMAGPVLLFGAAFPFAETLVSHDLPTLGRTTGWLLFAQIAGNVLGTVFTGFVLIEHLGTAGTYVALSVPPLVAGLVAAGLARPSRITAQRIAVAALAAALVVAAPSNLRLWSMLLGSPQDALQLAEDRSCASALVFHAPTQAALHINSRVQNGYPFTDFHVLLGLLPALAHPNPDRALAIGYGSGSTSYGLLASERVSNVTSVELCGGNYELSDELAERGAQELSRLADDPRHQPVVGDGRKHLLVTSDEYDLVVPDTLLPQTAGFTNLHSIEFLELVSEHLRDDGILSIWSATPRVDNAATATFPYVLRVVGGSVDPGSTSKMLLASRSPIDLDPDALLARFDRMPAAALSRTQRTSLRSILANLDVECFNDGAVPPRPDTFRLNLDLQPRDEYFLNNFEIGANMVSRTCGP